MTSPIIAQLKDVSRGAESLAASLSAIYLSPEAQTELDIIADKFRAVAILIGKKTQSFKPVWNDEIWEKSKEQREKAEKILTNVLTENKLPNKQVLRKNLITIFCGPEKYANDSQAMKSKKIATENRCAKLRQLSANGIISWAIAYPSGTWAGGRMGSDTFDCLLQDIEPNDRLHWPPEVNQTLAELQEGSFIQSEAFDKLAEDLSISSQTDGITDATIISHPVAQPPNQRNRGKFLSEATQ